MRKKAEDSYVKSLSKYNVVFYWHFIISSTIILIVIICSYKTAKTVNANAPKTSRDHLNRDMMYDYAEYFLKVYEPYIVNELNDEETTDEQEDVVESDEFIKDSINAEENNSENMYLDNNESTVNVNSENANYTNSSSENSDFVKKQDNLNNTIEKSNEIVYNNISEENIDDLTDVNNESELNLEIFSDMDSYNNGINNTVASDDTLNTLKKLQLDYINKVYYNYIVEYYTNDNSLIDSNEILTEVINEEINKEFLELPLYQIIILNQLLESDIESENKTSLIEEETTGIN